MSIYDDMLAALEGHAGNAALVGTRIYPAPFPAGGTFPLQTYSTVTAPTEQAVTGRIVAQRTGIQLDHWAESYKTTKDMAATAKIALLGMAGSTVDLHETRLWNELDTYDEGSGLYRHIQEWWFVHS